MRGAPEPEAHVAILDAVAELLNESGYEGFPFREVARRAGVSLARIYKLFGTREELIVATMQRWMAERGYAALAPPYPDLEPYEGLLYVLRAVFEPWERHPQMLEAFHRARIGTGGERLVAQGTEVIGPALEWVLSDTQPGYREDVETLLGNLFYAVFGRYADGELAIEDVLPTLERAALRLTSDNTSAFPVD